MLRQGHLGVSLLLYSPFAIVFSTLGYFDLLAIGGVATLCGGGLPDLDTKTPLLKHRGWTHTIYFALLVGTGFGLLGGMFRGPIAQINFLERQILIEMTVIHIGALFVFGTFGVLTHLAGDVVTKQGIRPFTPLLPRSVLAGPDRKYALRWFRAKNRLANGGALLLGMAALLGAVYAGLNVFS